MTKHDLCIMLVDIKNAFGSIPHNAIVELITDMHDCNTTQLLTSEGLSEQIDIPVGVKQSCPLSGPIFNLAINPIFKAVQGNRDSYHILDYADDLVIFEDSPDELNAAIMALSNFANKLGLQVNPKKCYSVHIDPTNATCKDTLFEINGSPIPGLNRLDTIDYLGKPIGFNIFNNHDKLEGFIDYGTKILSSRRGSGFTLLSAFLPVLKLCNEDKQFNKSDWKRLNDTLRPLIKATLNLPDRACNDYFYSRSKDGLFGVPLAGKVADIATGDSTFNLLMSIDSNVKIHAHARCDLKTCTADRIDHEPSLYDMENFLSGMRYVGNDNRYTIYLHLGSRGLPTS